MNNNTSSEFCIGDYRHLLVKNPSEKGRYICPICGGHNLSIAKNEVKYNCFDCGKTKEIAYELRKLNGEFNGKNQSNGTTLNITQTSDRVKQQDNESSVTKITNSIDCLDFLREQFPKKLRYNVRLREIEIDDNPINLDCIRAEIGDKTNVDITGNLLAECLQYEALKNSYDPVASYLMDCVKQLKRYPIESVAFGCFGTRNPLHIEYVKRWLIGCVARVLSPGCKFDEALVLTGKQGCGKSSFFRILANGYFTDSMTNKLDKDDLALLNRAWICEWSEIDCMSSKVYHGTIKHFLSKQDDHYRLPYGRSTQRLPRRSVIVGTTNRTDFLVDPSGSRRFWVVPTLLDQIPLKELESEREAIWGEAVERYLAGESWQLPEEFWGRQAEDNRNYEQTDPWEDVLEDYLATQEGADVTPLELFIKLEGMGYPVTRSKRDEMRLGDLLRRLGWERTRTSRGGKQIRVWRSHTQPT
jgi:predicted P-loop ATPase